MKLGKLFGTLTLVGTLVSGIQARADDHVVTVYRSFSPQTVTISVGDSVTWVSYDDFDMHTTTSNDGLWSAYLWEYGDYYTYYFDSPGTYGYQDLLNGLTGTVIVQAAANMPPTVSITSPSANTVFRAPASFNITANASDSDGGVTSVQFYVGANSVGTDSSAPYAASVSNLAAGNYTLYAVATDNSGAKNTNSISIVVNNPPSVSITNPAPNAVFSAPASFALKATASDSDGSVSQVQFFSGANSIGTATTSPYSVALNNLGVGTYSFTARALDNRGMYTTSSVVNVVVTSLSLGSPKARADKKFELSASGLVAGKTNLLQCSTSLTNWVSIATNVASGSQATFVDATATNAGLRFYRVIQLP